MDASLLAFVWDGIINGLIGVSIANDVELGWAPSNQIQTSAEAENMASFDLYPIEKSLLYFPVCS